MDVATPSGSGDRPTFEQAFAQAPATDSPAVTPSTETPAAEPSAPAAIEQAAAAPSAEVTPAEGPIPYPRFKEVNEAKKTLEDQLNTLKQQFGWAESVDRTQIEAFAPVAKLYQTDRPAFIRQVMAEALTDANLAPLIRSEAARVLGARTQPVEPNLDPDIPVFDDKGQEVSRTYSAERVQAILKKEIEAALAPYASERKQREERQAADKAAQERQALIEDIYTEACDVLPGFKEHEAEISKVFETIPGDPAKALRAAWKQVVGGKLANADTVKAKTLDELKTKAAASTVNPASAAVVSTNRPKSFSDPSLSWS